MSFADYAKHRGVSRNAVTLAVKEGRIKPERGPDGKRGVYSETADKQWEASTFVNEIVEAPVSVGTPKTYTEVRIEREEIQAKLLQLKYDELAGELVPAKAVEAEWSALATLVKSKVLGIASKMKQRYSNLSIEQYEYLDQLAREALEELADGQD